MTQWKAFLVTCTDTIVQRADWIDLKILPCPAKKPGQVCRASGIVRTMEGWPPGQHPPGIFSNETEAQAVLDRLTACDFCGRPIDKTTWSKSGSGAHVWRREDTGETSERVDDFGPGAIYRAHWLRVLMENQWDNWPDEDPIVCVTPGGPWIIDSRANNCTMKEERTHRCWVRHGIAPNLHVDKQGHTCAAGAGSIQCNDFHGFLHGGVLLQC